MKATPLKPRIFPTASINALISAFSTKATISVDPATKWMVYTFVFINRRFLMRTLATVLSGLAFLASFAATIYLLNAPLYQHVEIVHTDSGEETIQGTSTLVEANGTWVINQLVLVTLVSGVPLFVALRRSAFQRLVTWVCALLLMAYSIAGSFTIGLAFMPSAILLLIAAIATLFIRKGADH